MSNILGALICFYCIGLSAVIAISALAGLLIRCPSCGSRDTANIDCTHRRCNKCWEAW